MLPTCPTIEKESGEEGSEREGVQKKTDIRIEFSSLYPRRASPPRASIVSIAAISYAASLRGASRYKFASSGFYGETENLKKK